MATKQAASLDGASPRSLPDTDQRSWYTGGFRCIVLPKIYIVDKNVRDRIKGNIQQQWEALGFFMENSSAIQYSLNAAARDDAAMQAMGDDFYGSSELRNAAKLNAELANVQGKVDYTDPSTAKFAANRSADRNGNAPEPGEDGRNFASSADNNAALKDPTVANIDESIIMQSCADTSLGGNDVINPYWSYNEDDDIVHPQTAYNRKLMDTAGMNLEGLGRVYSENINRYQQILWMNMGLPHYKGSISSLFGGSAYEARIVNRGNTLGATIGSVLGTIFSVIFVIPLLPLYGIMAICDLFNVYPVSKYFEHRSCMPMYYKFCNVLIGHMAVNLGLYQATEDLLRRMGKWCADKEKKEKSGIDSGRALYKAAMAGTPEILENGPDMMMIMYKRQIRAREYSLLVNGKKDDSIFQGTDYYFRHWLESTSEDSTTAIENARTDLINKYNERTSLRNSATPDQSKIAAIDNEIKDMTTRLRSLEAAITNAEAERSWYSKFATWLTRGSKMPHDVFAMMFGTGLQSLDYIGFRVEKTTSVSESSSNTTGPLEIAGQVNGMAQQGRAKQNSALGTVLSGKTGFDLLDGSMNTIGAFLNKMADNIGLGNAVNVVTGNGFADIPEAWQSSSFSKSYSVEFQLRARYGDPVSWLQAVGIPLACLLAAALPRGVGGSMYTSPFLVRAYCKGMFSIPTGIIESISMTRGAAEFGWSINKLPLAIDVNITIKDLSPILYVGMDNDMNSGLDEYMSTLTGLGLYERTMYWPAILRRINRCLLLKRNTIANPLYWGNVVGNFGVSKMIATLSTIGSPYSRPISSD